MARLRGSRMSRGRIIEFLLWAAGLGLGALAYWLLSD